MNFANLYTDAGTIRNANQGKKKPNSTSDLIKGFVLSGFKTLVVAMRSDLKPDVFLGRVIDEKFINEFGQLSDVDLCGEHGEYHTYVFDGPLFRRPASYAMGEIYEEKKHRILPIHAKQ